MNTKTKDALILFARQVEALTAGVVLTIGVNTAGDILTSCEQLIQALNQDKTIKEEQ